MRVNRLKLCLVTHIQNCRIEQYLDFINAAIQGGVTCIQLRVKNKSLIEINQIACSLKKLLDSYSIPLIINDYVELAKQIDAAGVHIGASDMSPDKAREILGPEKIIGLSIESLIELDQANLLTSIDYVAASAVFASHTKLDCKKIWGLSGLREILSHSKHPVIAIGGINQGNIRDVIATGVQGVAVVSAIHEAANPTQSAANLMTEINNA